MRIDESIARHVALALPAAGAVEMEGAPGAIDGDPIAVLQRQGVKLLGGYLITVWQSQDSGVFARGVS